jgi:aspartate/methionine/tyrosine aminotransferase
MSRTPSAISQRIADLRPTAVNAILAEVRQLQAQGKPLVSLMRGEPDFDTPPHIVEAATRALADGRTHYPDNRGELALREAIAERIAQDHGLQYDPGSEVLVTSGATFGIYAALAAVLDDGDEVLVPDPIYDAYHSPVRLVGGRVRSVPATIRNGRFSIDADVLDTAWTPACKALLLNTPWNPVGTVFTESELEAIAGFVERRNLVLISDEIYESIVYAPSRHRSPALVKAIRDRTILVNSLSKTYAMTGWRLGYCAGPSELMQAMYLVLQQSSRGPATFVQDAGVAALRSAQTCVSNMRVQFEERRRLVGEQIRDIPRVSLLSPEGGFFALVDVRELGPSSDTIRRALLHDSGVVVVHGAAYGPSGEGLLRVSFATGGRALENGLGLLKSGLLRIGQGQSPP